MLRRPCSAPSRTPPAQRHYAVHSRKIVLAYAQQLTTVHSAATGLREDEAKGKPAVPVQASRPPLPCEKPLPLANVMEVQRLLYLLEAPEYCLRAFREHGVNGQDLLHMQAEDLDDSRFKFPGNVQRKVFRIAEAWRAFQLLAGGPTHCNVSMERFMEHHRSLGRSAEAISELVTAFKSLDVNNNGSISFEDFLVGFTLLEAADKVTAAASQPPAPAAPAVAADSTTASVGAATAGAAVDRLGPGTGAGASAGPATLGSVGPLAALAPLTGVLSACSGTTGRLVGSVASWFRL